MLLISSELRKLARRECNPAIDCANFKHMSLAFTAPAYDALTKPVEAPYPSVCMYSDRMPCRCWSQRGFRLDVPDLVCRQLAREPMDPYWLRRGDRGFDRGGGVSRESSSRDGQAGVVPPIPTAIPVAATQAASQADAGPQ